ncbi:MAG: hypothetical protein ACE5Q6_17525 [Dehalococcoidia bacterium]
MIETQWQEQVTILEALEYAQTHSTRPLWTVPELMEVTEGEAGCVTMKSLHQTARCAINPGLKLLCAQKYVGLAHDLYSWSPKYVAPVNVFALTAKGRGFLDGLRVGIESSSEIAAPNLDAPPGYLPPGVVSCHREIGGYGFWAIFRRGTGGSWDAPEFDSWFWEWIEGLARSWWRYKTCRCGKTLTLHKDRRYLLSLCGSCDYWLYLNSLD